jgi:hypothetical protein
MAEGEVSPVFIVASSEGQSSSVSPSPTPPFTPLDQGITVPPLH